MFLGRSLCFSDLQPWDQVIFSLVPFSVFLVPRHEVIVFFYPIRNPVTRLPGVHLAPLMDSNLSLFPLPSISPACVTAPTSPPALYYGLPRFHITVAAIAMRNGGVFFFLVIITFFGVCTALCLS